MVAELGQFVIVFALAAAVVQAATGLVSGWDARLGGREGALAGAAERAALAQGGLTLAAFIALTIVHATDDFSVVNVVENSHSAKPLAYKIAGVWGNHEGSMLLWCLILALYGAAIALFARGPNPVFRARVLGVMGLVSAAFTSFTVFTSNPFERLFPAAADGFDLNPLLQDPGLIIHPPLLYVGYVGFAAPFAFAIAAMLDETRGAGAWAGWARPWALTAWSFLTLGLGVGSWWAYYELGWGGFWAWDPTENAPLMSWLAGTALIHTLKSVKARGAFKSWALLLAILTFSLSLVGAFLVRSGILTSVHAFAVDSERGVYLLMILAVTVGASLTLYAFRSQTGRPVGFALASRETGLLVNNLLLMTILGTVLMGTFYPVFSDVLTGERASVGAPFFNLVVTPFALLLLIAAGIGSRLPWRRGDLRAALRSLAPVGGVALVVGALFLALYEPRHATAALAIAVAAWLAGSVVVDLVARIEPLSGSVRDRRERLVRIPLGAWAMNTAHFGIAIMVFAAAGTGALRTERIEFMTPGDAVAMAGGRSATLLEVTEAPGPNYAAERALFDIQGRFGQRERMTVERRYYPVRDMETAEAGVLTGALGDVYITVGVRRDERGWPVSASFFPFGVWLWVATGVIALGGGLGVAQHVRAHAGRRGTADAAPATGAGAPTPVPAE